MSSRTGTAFERAQFGALAALQHVPRRLRPRLVPMFAPPALVHAGATSLSSIYKDVFVRRIYDARRPLRTGARILDCGAHVGLASIFFLRRYPTARVVSIEGNPRTVPMLERNLARWSARNTVVGRPLAATPGPAPYFVTLENPQNVNAGLTNRASATEAVEQLEVDCIGVDDVLTEPVDLVKLDVEGTEYGLLGSEAFEPGTVRELVVEFHDVAVRADELGATVERLVRRGYRASDSVGGALSAGEQAGVAPSLAPGVAVCVRFET